MSRHKESGDLESLLVGTQFLSAAQLATAKQEAEARQRGLAQVIVELGMVGERQFAEWMSQMTSIPIVDPIPPAVVEPLVRRVPRAMALEYEVVPLKFDGSTLTVATINPLDSACMAALHAKTALNIRLLIGLHSTVKGLLAHFYPEDNPPPFDPSDTMVATKPEAIPAPIPRAVESQLDRVERALGEVRKLVVALQERMDAIDETLEHLSSRR
jgi:hypothetical protein